MNVKIILCTWWRWTVTRCTQFRKPKAAPQAGWWEKIRHSHECHCTPLSREERGAVEQLPHRCCPPHLRPRYPGVIAVHPPQKKKKKKKKKKLSLVESCLVDNTLLWKEKRLWVVVRWFSLSPKAKNLRLKFRPYLYVKFLDMTSTVCWSPHSNIWEVSIGLIPTVFHFKNNAEFPLFFRYEIQAFFFWNPRMSGHRLVDILFLLVPTLHNFICNGPIMISRHLGTERG